MAEYRVGEKWCKGCERWRKFPLHFYNEKFAWCIDCHRERQKEYNRRAKERRAKMYPY